MLLLIRWSLVRVQPGEPIKSMFYVDARDAPKATASLSLHHGYTTAEAQLQRVNLFGHCRL